MSRVRILRTLGRAGVGDGADGCDGLSVGEVVEAEASPVAGEDEGEFVVGEGLVLVGEADAAVELGEDGEAFLEAGHADEQQPETASVKAVAEVFEGGWGEPVGFVDDDELDVLEGIGLRITPGRDVLVDADVDALDELVVEFPRSGGQGLITQPQWLVSL